MSRVIMLLVVCGVLAALPACEPRPADTSSLFGETRESVAGVVLDLSGSYAHLMLDEGKAWKFFGAFLDQFYRDHVGSDADRIVIAQISAKDKALLWEGSPLAMKRDFASAQAFREFLRLKSDPNGSRVHDSIFDLVEHIRTYPGVAEGKTRSAIFVLSDMEDNFPDSEASKERLVRSLEAYARVPKSVIGMYWVAHQFCGDWKRRLQQAGFSSGRCIVESEIVSDPTIPSSEQ